MCAVMYVLLLDDLNRRIATETQAALFARAMGEDVAVPDPVAIRRRFDELLCAEPAEVAEAPTTRAGVLAEAFGLSGGR